MTIALPKIHFAAGRYKYGLLLFLIAPTLCFAQIGVHYRADTLTLDAANRTLSGKVYIDVTNLGDSNLTKLTLVNWVNAYQPKHTYLSDEMLEAQSLSMRFAKPYDLGYNAASIKKVEAEESTTIEADKEIFELRINLPAKNTTTLVYSFLHQLPNRKFNGYGIDENTLVLSHWLPRLARHTATDSTTTPNSRNREAWFWPATYHLSLQTAGKATFSSNLDINALGQNQYLLQKSTPQQDALLVVFSGGTIVPVNANETQISLCFSGDYPPLNTNNSWEKIVNFLGRELGWLPPDSLKIVVLTQKNGIQSAGNCVVVEATKLQEELEAAIIEELIKIYAIEVLNVNPALHPVLVAGLANYYKHQFYSNLYPEKMMLGPLSNTAFARFFKVEDYPVRYQNRLLYLYMARQGLDQPLSDTVFAYNRFNREAVLQGKSVLWYSYMRNFVGEKNFLRAIRRFAQVGNGTPEDLINAMKYYHFQDVNWLLDSLYTTTGKIDYKIKRTDHCNSVYTATIKNNGNIATPFSITGYKNGKPVLTEWHTGFTGKKTIPIHFETYDEVRIDAARATPDINQKNNSVRTHGLLKHTKPFDFQFYTSLDNPDKTQVYWVPSLKYNAYDQFLIGAAFYNTNLVRKPIEYRVAPDFSTGTGQLTGTASIKFNVTPAGSPFHLISFGLYGRYYHYAPNLAFSRFSPTLTLNFRKKQPRSLWLHTLRLRGVLVDKEIPADAQNNAINNYQVFDFRYRAENGSVLRPIIANFDMQVAQDFARLSLDITQRLRLTKNHLMTARLFYGGFIAQSTNLNEYFTFGLSGTTDYLFDYYLLGRSDQSGLWSQQFFVTDGGFKSRTPIFSTSLLAANVNLPIYRYFGAFTDVAYDITNAASHWDAGFYISILPDFAEVYFPLAGNNFELADANQKYIQKIRFVLNLELEAIITRARRGWY